MSYICPECDQSFKTMQALGPHRANSHGYVGERTRASRAKHAQHEANVRRQTDRRVTCPTCLCEMDSTNLDKHMQIPHTELCETCGALCTPVKGGISRDIVWHRRTLHGDTTTHATMSLEQRALSRGWPLEECHAICDEAIVLMRELDARIEAGGTVLA